MVITLSPQSDAQARRERLSRVQRLVRKHDELEVLIDARRRHGLSTSDAWLAMVRLEDTLRAESPRSYSAWLAAWLTRPQVDAHAISGTDASCPLCPAPGRRPISTAGGR